MTMDKHNEWPSWEELAQVVAGRLEGGLGPPPQGVSTDTRSLAPGDLFVALRGKHHDGHDYLQAALARGAVGLVVEHAAAELPPSVPQLVVEDTLPAYGRLAAYWRGLSQACVIGLTGSAGKTTTKRLLAGLLERSAPTVASAENENNEIGVPHTLLRLGAEHEYAVVEMGMRGRGEIAYLAELAQPAIGVITNVGVSHVGLLGGREAIAQTKAELLAALPPTGVAVLNADDFFWGLLSEMAPCPVISFGAAATAEVRAENIVSRGWAGSSFTLWVQDQSLEVNLSLPGRHSVSNALAAVATYWQATGDLEQVAAALAVATPEPGRGEVLSFPDGTVVLNDCYNASPTSMEAALALLAEAPGRKVAVLGDMLELGDWSEEEHRKLGERAWRAGVALVVAVGQYAGLLEKALADSGVEVVTVDNAEAAATEILPRRLPGDTILVKGSRALGLERVVESLQEALRG
jgi:UDP-N-acetylmuramoyl-tripeptide--D-alanyl-D-alanine ligase